MKTVSLIVIFLACVFASTLFSNATAQILVPGIHGISMIPGLKFTWVIILSDHEVSLNIRYSGNGTTPPVTLTVTALANPKATDMIFNQTSMPTTIAASQVINAGWSSPNSITINEDVDYNRMGKCPFCDSRIDEFGYCACGGNLGVS
jgi:hypothetical protein